MKITVMTGDGRIISLDVDPNELVENVKALLEVETQVALQQQRVFHNGKEIGNPTSLSSAGIVDGDLLTMVSTASSSSEVNAPDMRMNADGSAVNPRAFQQYFRGNLQLLNQLRERNPEFAQAIVGEDIERLQNILRQQHGQQQELRRRQQEELDLLNADPFDVEAQKKIEEAIRQKNIDENWEAALEYNPEAFARVMMLFVDMEVNGVPIKGFIDSGAQITIISRSCAERCGLLRLLDRRYVGIARGVGQSEIVGKIHVAPIKIGKNFYPCSFTVLDNPNMDFIFGLDMLRKHQCCIDLKENVLRMGGGEIAVPFLQEKDIPSHLGEEDALIQPPGGTSSSSQPPSAPQLGQASAQSPVRAQRPPEQIQRAAPSSTPNVPAASEMEAKISKLAELGFDRESAARALTLFNGNEEMAASYLFSV